ncbi:MAG: hypothetical protein ACOH2A_06925 [Sphingobacteriaceae bacterium]
MPIPYTTPSGLIEVFRTVKGTVFQSDTHNCLYVDFGNSLAEFNYQKLKRLKNACDQINVDELLLNTENAAIEIIYLCACEHLYVLSIMEVIQLRELLDGAFVMFQLNHIINDCLYRLVS